MHNALVVTGTLTDSRNVTLDEPIPVSTPRVRLIVEPLPAEAPRSYPDVMAAIRERQRARGHRPPSREEVDASIQAERASWGD